MCMADLPLRHRPEAEDRGAITDEDADAWSEQRPYRLATAIGEDLIDRRCRRRQRPQRHQLAAARPARGVGMLDACVLNLVQRFLVGAFKCLAGTLLHGADRTEGHRE